MAGFSVERDRITELKQYLNEHFIRSTEGVDNALNLPIDGLITAAANGELLKQLEKLEPFGAET